MTKKIITFFMALLFAQQSFTAGMSAVTSVFKVLMHQTERSKAIGRIVFDQVQQNEYKSALANSIEGISQIDDQMTAPKMIKMIEHSDLAQTQKDQLINLLSKDISALKKNEMNDLTEGIAALSHSVNPDGVLLSSCKSECFATTSGLAVKVDVVRDTGIKKVLKRYRTERKQSSRVNNLLRKLKMAPLKQGLGIVRDNQSDLKAMLIYLELIAAKSVKSFNSDSINFARQIKEFSKNEKGAYVHNRLYRLLVDIAESNHGTYARIFSDITKACTNKFPKDDCFYQQLKIKGIKNQIPEDEIDTVIAGMKKNNCFF